MTPRDAFLNLCADGQLEIDYDADQNEYGRMIDCSTFRITGPLSVLQDMCEALGIQSKREQSLDDAIQEAIEAPANE